MDIVQILTKGWEAWQPELGIYFLLLLGALITLAGIFMLHAMWDEHSG